MYYSIYYNTYKVKVNARLVVKMIKVGLHYFVIGC